jgi:predicted metal-dependent hydrolase
MGDVILTSQQTEIMAPYKRPFANLKAELLVQLLVALLMRRGTSRMRGDDPAQFKAALRTRHGERHFSKTVGYLPTALIPLVSSAFSAFHFHCRR